MQPQATQTPPVPTEQKTEPVKVADAGMPAETPKAPAKTKYGKRPVWQWVLIYLILAIIVYGIIYYVWIRKSGTGTGSTGGY